MEQVMYHVIVSSSITDQMNMLRISLETCSCNWISNCILNCLSTRMVMHRSTLWQFMIELDIKTSKYQTFDIIIVFTRFKLVCVCIILHVDNVYMVYYVACFGEYFVFFALVGRFYLFFHYFLAKCKKNETKNE